MLMHRSPFDLCLDFLCSTGHFHSEYNLWRSDQIKSLQFNSLIYLLQDAFLLHFPVSGNYYGTPRPIHVSAESPPITYQEHRNLLRNFRTRSKSLSNLEKTAEGGENSEDDSGLSGKCHLNLIYMMASVDNVVNVVLKKKQDRCLLMVQIL